MLKKLSLFALSFGFIWTLNLNAAHAIEVRSGLDDAAGINGAGYVTSRDITDVIGGIISAILGILGVVFLILVIYAGFLWMTAAGDDKKVGTAKNILISAVAGLALILAAYAITDFVIGSLQKASTGSITSS